MQDNHKLKMILKLRKNMRQGEEKSMHIFNSPLLGCISCANYVP